MRRYTFTMLSLIMSMVSSALHLLMMLLVPSAFPSMAILSAFYLGQALSKYTCEKNHNPEYIKTVIADSVQQIEVVKQAEDILHKGF